MAIKHACTLLKAHACIALLPFESLHHYRKQLSAVYPEIEAAVVHAPFCYKRSFLHAEKSDLLANLHLVCKFARPSALFHYPLDIAEVVAVPVKASRSGLLYDLRGIKIGKQPVVYIFLNEFVHLTGGPHKLIERSHSLRFFFFEPFILAV